jgi:hypothetical protein
MMLASDEWRGCGLNQSVRKVSHVELGDVQNRNLIEKLVS